MNNNTAQAIKMYETYFSQLMSPRSTAYKEGFLYALCRKFDEIEKSACPYKESTAECDAWFYGGDDGYQHFEGLEIR